MGLSPGQVAALCSWARQFTSIVPLSTRVCKWVTANLLLGGGGGGGGGGLEILLVAFCFRNWDKLQLECRLFFRLGGVHLYGGLSIRSSRFNSTKEVLTSLTGVSLSSNSFNCCWKALRVTWACWAF